MEVLAIQFWDVQVLQSILHSKTCAFSGSGFLQKVIILHIWHSSSQDIQTIHNSVAITVFFLVTEDLHPPSIS